MAFPDPNLTPHLTKDSRGFVYYKGQEVEHYSFSSDPEGQTNELKAFHSLYERCVKAEYLGLPINSGTVTWHWSWFSGMDNTHPYLPLLRMRPAFYVQPDEEIPLSNVPNGYYREGHDGSSLLIQWSSKGHCEFRLWDSLLQALVAFCPPQADSLDSFYHPLTALGWRTPNAGQNVRNGNGLVYATTEGITAFLERMKIPHHWTPE
jgi:hypothetical protein